jgi:hypothetical protein
MRHTLRHWLFGLLFIATASHAATTEPAPEVAKDLETLVTLQPALDVALKDLASLRQELSKAATDEARKELGERVEVQRQRVEQLRDNFHIIATGVDESSFDQKTEEIGSFDTQWKELFKPLFSEIREATSKPREMEHFRDEKRIWDERYRLATEALGKINRLIPVVPPKEESVLRELQATKKVWSSRQQEALSQSSTLALQIEDRERTTPTVWQAISAAFAGFWRSRGLNLLLALVVAAGIYLSMKRIYVAFRQYSPVHRRGQNLMARAADLIATFSAVLCAMLGVLAVFYFRGDWLLLTLVIFLYLGILWATKHTLPPYLEQFRMILNLGPVRIGERMVFDGIPWRVDQLNFYCEFTNPELTGGVLRLPIRDVMPLHSRPADPKEPWFPTVIDDWVRLNDGTYGKVIQQSPEQVVVLRLGNSLKTYATKVFLAAAPENLSKGFRISAKFSLDVQDHAQALEQVPQSLQRTVFAGLVELVGNEQIKSVQVELAEVSNGSMIYAILAGLDGEAASKLPRIERAIQRLCLQACVEHQWQISTPQLTVFQKH